MSGHAAFGWINLALGGTMAVGSQTFLAPCVHEDGSFGSCHWAGQMMLGLGILLCVLALCSLLARQPAGRAGLYLAQGLAGALGFLVPGTLIALCGMHSMRCRAIMQPGMRILCAATVLMGIVGGVLEWRKAKRGQA